MDERQMRMMNYIKQNRWVVILLILSITIIWGYAWTLMKEALQYMGPFTFSAFRFGVGAVTMFGILLFFKVGLPERKYWKHLFIVGLLQTAIVFLLVMYGLKFVEAGKSSILLYSMPIWSSLLAMFILKDRLIKPQVVGLAVGLIGLLTILGWDLWLAQSAATVLGEMLIVVAAISWGLSNIYYRLFLKGMSQLQVNGYQMAFGALAITIVALITESDQAIVWNLESVYYVLFTGVLASALCFTVWFILLSVIDMVTATISTLLVPVFGLFFGWLLLNEPLTANIMIGTVLIVIGISIANLYKKSPTR
ncbi:DMT family transporter [Alkalibacillus haloalkaliphilus]|uniref:Putative transporter YoaV n=1 Tax=Alkalibacillus haloalkaliphilus TaxID=94136 RepID=A0A511W4Y0_9BACI|nr:DMT family transporter [Alkalibacillus haloalkaliphilus]GEN45073.1 putative transporter YoaV [Alkalibacillus haloalkaliphilus]